MDYLNMLKDLSVYPGVSGYESDLSNYLKHIFKNKCDSVEVDRFFNVIGIKKGQGSKKRKIMITAHLDEIGLLVKSIDERGFLKFSNIGGIDSKILLAQEVIVHGKKDILGVIGAKPPHLLKPEDVNKAVKMGDLSIDTGLSVEQVKKYISIGDIITLKATPFVLQGNKVSSKSLDNRCGVVALLAIMDKLNKVRHDADIYFIATSQEEFELAGVTTAAYNIRPDIAVVIDACHGDMPDASKEDTYVLGKGPAIGIGPNLHKRITNKIIEIAKEESIPYQIDVEPGDTGTEAWAVQVSRSGIPTALISIPVRYMHTTVETVSIDDIKNTAKITSEFIVMGDNEMEEFLCF